MKWEDLKWWEHSPDDFFGQDKEGNVYCIDSETGEIVPTPNVSIDIMWPGANKREVEQYIEKLKTQKMEINLSDYEWYEDGPDFIYAIDKKGNVYGLGNDGELALLPNRTPDSSYGWSHTEHSFVKQYIERKKAKKSVKKSFADREKNKDKMNLIHEAIIFAALKHAGQLRKGTDIPYISHPMEVALILTENGCTENVIIAGILHDTLEDTGTTPAEILEHFGEEILKIVAAESEDKSKTWKERKQATIDHLAGATLEARLVCCADKLSNLRSVAADKETVGNKLWERFNAEKDDIEWYYRGIAAALPELAGYKMYGELTALNNEVF